MQSLSGLRPWLRLLLCAPGDEAAAAGVRQAAPFCGAILWTSSGQETRSGIEAAGITEQVMLSFTSDPYHLRRHKADASRCLKF
jgi:hypothetical protein